MSHRVLVFVCDWVSRIVYLRTVLRVFVGCDNSSELLGCKIYYYGY